jgi:hypothetical protein
MSKPRMTDREKLERKAARKTAKDRADAPLFAFAGLVPETTAADVAFRGQVNRSRGVELVHQACGPGVKALAWVQLNAIERYAETVLSAEDFAGLVEYSRRTYASLHTYGYSFWQEVLTGGRRVVMGFRQVDDPTCKLGFRLVPTVELPRTGWVAPLTRDEFWARFPYREPELGPDDPAGLFDQVMSALGCSRA